MAALNVKQGATYRATFTWMTSAASPTPIPLAGYNGRFRLLKYPGGTVALEVQSTASPDAASDSIQMEPSGATGQVQIRLAAATTAALTSNLSYEVDLVKANDPTEVVALASGSVLLTKAGS